MSSGMSRADLIQFVVYMGEKGLMNTASASARKSSINTFLGFLPEDEVMDVTKLDLDAVTKKFINLKGGEFKPASVAVYKSRTESAIKDFAAYKTNPLSFKPKVGQRKKESKALPSVSTGQSEPIRSVASVPSFQAEDNIFPIPLRQNLTVRIAGIPADLTSAEARKISNVIMALAMAD